MSSDLKGRSEGWTRAMITGLARYSAADIIAVVDWYQLHVPGPAGQLIVAGGDVPSRGRITGNVAPVKPRRDAALVAFAAGNRTPPFSWSRSIHHYVDAAGLLVPWALVRDARNKAIAAASLSIKAVTELLISGKETIGNWQRSVAETVKMSHGALGALAMGGWAGMSVLDWENVSLEVGNQFGYLEGFADALGIDYRVDGRVFARANQYSLSARRTWFNSMGRRLVQIGYDLERNLLSAVENCDECVGQTALGWVPHGVLVDIGSRTCLNYCACEIQYRSSLTGTDWNDSGD